MASSGAQYFEPKPTAASSRRTQTVALPDLSFTLQTDRGVFSSDGLDTGTRLLLLEAPLPAQAGALLDLGCGAGPIAVTMARRAPRATVWAIDVNERARQLTVDNAADNSLPNISVAAPDDVPEDIRFQTIWSNPPIRIGKAAMHEMLLRWLSRLTPDGTAILVVQKHLGADSLARWLGEQGYAVERLSSRAGFRLLSVTSSTSVS
jgi:16S rRNA (guanine1207-N2)-methyltransferase